MFDEEEALENEPQGSPPWTNFDVRTSKCVYLQTMLMSLDKLLSSLEEAKTNAVLARMPELTETLVGVSVQAQAKRYALYTEIENLEDDDAFFDVTTLVPTRDTPNVDRVLDPIVKVPASDHEPLGWSGEPPPEGGCVVD